MLRAARDDARHIESLFSRAMLRLLIRASAIAFRVCRFRS